MKYKTKCPLCYGRLEQTPTMLLCKECEYKEKLDKRNCTTVLMLTKPTHAVAYAVSRYQYHGYFCNLYDAKCFVKFLESEGFQTIRCFMIDEDFKEVL